MAKAHKHAGATASISTALDASRIAELAENAAKQAETIQVMIRLEESSPGRLVYSARNRLLGGMAEFMTFEVRLSGDSDAHSVRTQILSYKQKRQWIFLIPLPWQMLGWGNYRNFMRGLTESIKKVDSSAQTSVIEFAQAAAR
jgi:hypothetical protein